MAIFRPKSGQNGHLKETDNIYINVNRPCDILNSRICLPWLIYTKPGVINHLWWPIWPFLEQKWPIWPLKRPTILRLM